MKNFHMCAQCRKLKTYLRPFKLLFSSAIAEYIRVDLNVNTIRLSLSFENGAQIFCAVKKRHLTFFLKAGNSWRSWRMINLMRRRYDT